MNDYDYICTIIVYMGMMDYMSEDKFVKRVTLAPCIRAQGNRWLVCIPSHVCRSRN